MRVDAWRRRQLAADLGHHRGEGVHEPVGGRAQHLLVQVLALEVGQVDRVAHSDVHGLAGQQAWLLGVRPEDLLRPPLHEGYQRCAGGQRDADRAGVAAHRPGSGIAGDRAFRVDGDDQAVPDGGLGGAERVLGVGGAASHRDLLGRAQDGTDDRSRHQRVLGEESRGDAVVDHEVRDDEWVDVRDVVGGQHVAAALRQLLGPLPVALREGHEQRPDDEDDHPRGPRQERASTHGSEPSHPPERSPSGVRPGRTHAAPDVRWRRGSRLRCRRCGPGPARG